MEAPKAGNVTCSPTWAQPTPDGQRVFVACNKAGEIAEIDVDKWTLTRRIPAGEGVYNLAVTHDGRLLVATNKRGQSVSVFDAASGKELRRLPTRRKVVHGVAITRDPFLIYSSNVFAILGLRALFFVLAGMMDKFVYLKPGVAIILVFVGVKMLASQWVKIPTAWSLLAILLILAAAVALSLRRTAREARLPA
jgi:hypothetical protein